MSKDVITFMVCATIILLALIGAGVTINLNDKINMSKNIESAINKGVDPLSVKCAYDSSSTTTCITYAATAKK